MTEREMIVAWLRREASANERFRDYHRDKVSSRADLSSPGLWLCFDIAHGDMRDDRHPSPLARLPRTGAGRGCRRQRAGDCAKRLAS